MERTHRVSIYAAVESHSSEDAWGRPSGETFSGDAIATDVECNLQPLTGSVQQVAAGREIDATWRGFFPSDTALQQDQGLVVTAVFEDGEWIVPPASQPTTFRVKQVGYLGGGWDTEAMLGTTRERIPAE